MKRTFIFLTSLIISSSVLSQHFFLAGGFCVQTWSDIFVSDYSAWNKQRNNYLPTIRMGYFFSKRKNKLTIELNATGPYSYSDFGWQTVEILTQLSLGTRFIF
ncbi:MAG TPA: hypothetical protein VGQ04_18730 [Chitinophagaceae bacterium]|nr:hypothetical protein [Chitinophagaceae bacterium]